MPYTAHRGGGHARAGSVRRKPGPGAPSGSSSARRPPKKPPQAGRTRRAPGARPPPALGALTPFRRGWGVGGAEICTGQGALTCTNPTSHRTSLNRATSSAYTSVAPEISTGTRVPVPSLPYRSGRPDLYGRGGTGTLVPVQISGATEVYAEEVALFKDVPWLVGSVQVRAP